jgi:hypothetical protein
MGTVVTVKNPRIIQESGFGSSPYDTVTIQPGAAYMRWRTPA